MRVLHLIDHSPPLATSYVRRIMAIVRQQRALGWQTVHLTGFRHQDKTGEPSGARPARRAAAAPSADPAEASKLHFFRTPAPATAIERLPLLGAVHVLSKRLQEVVRLTRPDIIHAHSPVELALAALQVGRREGLPVVFEVHAPSSRAQPGTVWSRTPGRERSATRAWAECVLEQWAARQAGAVVTNSEWLRNRLLAAGVRNTRMYFIPDGVGPGTRTSAGARPQQREPAERMDASDAWLATPASRVDRLRSAQSSSPVHGTVAVNPLTAVLSADILSAAADTPAWWSASADEWPPLPSSRWTVERLATAAIHQTQATIATASDRIMIGFTVADCSASSAAALDAVFAAAAILSASLPGLRLLAACRDCDLAGVQSRAEGHGMLPRLACIVLAKEATSALCPATPALAARHQPAAHTGASSPSVTAAANPGPPIHAAVLPDSRGASINCAYTHLEQRSQLHRRADILVFHQSARHPAAAPPRGLLAAMAEGCLIVAADCPPHRAVVDHGRSGFLFAPDDSAALARTLHTLLKCRERWEAIQAAARWCIDFQRDWQANGERYDNLYHQLLEERRRR